MEPSSAVNSSTRDFWRGLTTPDFGVVKWAGILLFLTVVVLVGLVHRFHQRHERGELKVDGVVEDFSRVSIIASRGAKREIDPHSAKAFVFVGPSSMRCMLPVRDEAERIASGVAGVPVDVVEMCANRQSYSLDAALIDRFGTDFDGWVIVGVNRQGIGAKPTEARKRYYRLESTVIGFESEILRSESEAVGLPQVKATGWEFWDRRNFYYRTRLGAPFTFPWTKPYNPYFVRGKIDIGERMWRGWRLDEKSVGMHLASLERLAERVRKAGGAKLVLAEMPWVEDVEPEARHQAYGKDEEFYQRAMADWSARTGVPYLTSTRGIGITKEDFSDPRHIGSPEVRRKFLETVVRDLMSNPSL